MMEGLYFVLNILEVWNHSMDAGVLSKIKTGNIHNNRVGTQCELTYQARTLRSKSNSK
jgi:hypothetical protein